MRVSIDGMKRLEELGQGTYGIVDKYMGILGDNQMTVAVKKFKDCDDFISQDCIRELSAIKKLHHKYIIQIYGIAQQNNLPLSIMPCFDMTMYGVMRKHVVLNINIVKRFIQMLYDGIIFIHQSGFMHRDIKPQNILCMNSSCLETCVLRISDLGSTIRYIPERNNTLLSQTLWWRAPEVLLGHKQYTQNIDIWSLGVIFAQLIGDYYSFSGNSEYTQLINIFKILGTPSKGSFLQQLPEWNDQFPNFHSSIWESPNVVKYLSSLSNLDKNWVMQQISSFLSFDPESRNKKIDIMFISQTQYISKIWRKHSNTLGQYWRKTKDIKSYKLYQFPQILINQQKSPQKISADSYIKNEDGYFIPFFENTARSYCIDFMLKLWYKFNQNISFLEEVFLSILDRYYAKKEVDTTLFEQSLTINDKKKLIINAISIIFIASALYLQDLISITKLIRKSYSLESIFISKEEVKEDILRICYCLDFNFYVTLIRDSFTNSSPILDWAIIYSSLHSPEQLEDINNAERILNFAKTLSKNDMFGTDTMQKRLQNIKLHWQHSKSLLSNITVRKTNTTTSCKRNLHQFINKKRKIAA